VCLHIPGRVLTCLAVCLGALHAQTAPSATRPCDAVTAQARDLTPDLPPLPQSRASLIGGIVTRVDPVRDRITLRAFGGRDVTVNYDVRTCVARGNTLASLRDIKPGTRIYADTILNDGHIFAKALRLPTDAALGETQGQVTGYDPGKRILRVRDTISSRGFDVMVTGNTQIRASGQSVQPGELRSGALVRIVFKSANEGTNLAEKIDVLAQPGGEFTFSGRVLSVDLRNGYMTLAEPDSQNTFEVALDSVPTSARSQLREGEDVVVQARFDGSKYQARSVELSPQPHQ
jgi:uncharacterized protein DUF5666